MGPVPEILNGKSSSRCDTTTKSGFEDAKSSSQRSKTLAVDTGEMQQQQQPPDGGWGWMVVIGSILTGCLVPTLFICFGVFMNVFMDVFPETSKSTAAWIPSIMNALMNCMGPITSALVTKYSARAVTFSGAAVLSSGLVLSYFTNSVEALYLTYGIMGGIGAGLSFAPGLYLISQYFKQRRGVATGICMAGGSIGHIIFPHIIQGLLDEYSYNGCFLILGGLTMNICVSAALFRPYEPIKAEYVAEAKKKSKNKAKKNSNRSLTSLTFIPDEGILPRNGSYSSMSSNSVESRKDSESRSKKIKTKKKRKLGNNNRKSNGNKDKKENFLLGADKNWQSLLKPADVVIVVSQSSPRGRSRTLSIDSSRILPGIPEEKEEEKPGEDVLKSEPNGQNLCKVIEDMEDSAKGIEDQESPKNFQESQAADTSIQLNQSIAVDKCFDFTSPALDSDGIRIEDVEEFSKDVGGQETTKKCGMSDEETAGVNGCDTRHRTERTVSADSAFEPMFDQRPWVQRSDSMSEVVTLNHMFGSVASITSLGSLPKKHRKMNTLNIISHSLGFEYFKFGIFYVLAGSFSLLIISLGSFTMFIPTYGFSIDLSREESAGLLSIIATASLFGRLSLPASADYITLKRKHIYCVSAIVSSMAVLGTIFVNTYTELAICLVVFGFSSGGCLALSINVFLDYITVERFTSFFGLVGFVVGLSNLFATPLMGLLVDSTGSYIATFSTLAAASAFSGLVLYLDRFTVGISNIKSKSNVV